MSRFKSMMAVILAAIIFGFMPLFARIIYAEGGNAFTLCFYRFLLATPLMAAAFQISSKRTGSRGSHRGERQMEHSNSYRVEKDEILPLLVLSSFYAFTPVLLFSSYSLIDTSMASTLHFVYPVFVLLLSVWQYKEKLNRGKWLSCLICLLGIFLFYRPGASIRVEGILLAVISGFSFAYYLTAFGHGELKKWNRYKLGFYMLLISSIELFVVNLVRRDFSLKMSTKGWLVTLLFAVMTSFFATLLIQSGIQGVGAFNSAILSTFEPITSVLLGVLLLKESLGVQAFLGMICILASIIILARSQSDESAASSASNSS